MTIQLGVVMDPIATIKAHKDSTFAMALEAQRRDWVLTYIEQRDLFARDGEAWARMRPLTVADDPQHWFTLGAERTAPLSTLDAVLMRKDPPFDLEYIYSTYLLELAERRGVLVVNRPQALRDHNEKLAITGFAHCIPPTLVSRERARLRDFAVAQQEVVIKPLDTMGGGSVFRVRADDPNLSVILELMTQQDTRTVMAQRFVPEISAGDKRILLIDGVPVPWMLARIPAAGETRGNLAAGARAEGRALGARERWLCDQVGPALRERGLLFVGLDVIGDFLTEINVTSPTGIRELDRLFGLNIAGLLIDAIAHRLPPAAARSAAHPAG
ncbi:MAG: glutathione synthase [Proteobacteria bacterium]|nr:glutathione synthase [Pseudomonadota bacterium]